MFCYSFGKDFSIAEIEKLFKSVDWESGNYPQELYSAISNSETVVSARSREGELVGLMTAISDGTMNVFFPYLLVNPKYQGNGIGKNIVSIMLEHYKKTYRKALICSLGNIPFYEQYGFNALDDQKPMMITGFGK